MENQRHLCPHIPRALSLQQCLGSSSSLDRWNHILSHSESVWLSKLTPNVALRSSYQCEDTYHIFITISAVWIYQYTFSSLFILMHYLYNCCVYSTKSYIYISLIHCYLQHTAILKPLGRMHGTALAAEKNTADILAAHKQGRVLI